MVELRQAKLLQGLPESELRSLEKQMKTVKHPAGHEITVRGENGVGFMIILDGDGHRRDGPGQVPQAWAGRLIRRDGAARPRRPQREHQG